MKAKFVNEAMGDVLRPRSENEVIRVLSSLSQEDKDKQLLHASHGGHKDFVQMLLDAGADVNAKNYNGATPLARAAMVGHTDIVKMLLDAGADVNAKSRGGWSALMYASYFGYQDIVELLKKYGAKD